MSLNPISSQSLTVFIYLFISCPASQVLIPTLPSKPSSAIPAPPVADLRATYSASPSSCAARVAGTPARKRPASSNRFFGVCSGACGGGAVDAPWARLGRRDLSATSRG